MPGDTKIRKTTTGWIDVDVPTQPYAARWQARKARRDRLAGAPTLPTRVTSLPTVRDRLAGTVTVPTSTTPSVAPSTSTLSPLQQRLYDRLTQRQGVSAADAYDVVVNNGYNKAASYGHMRSAGATHEEALEVVDLDSPSISLSYGLARFAGLGHTAAFVEALRDLMDDDSDD